MRKKNFICILMLAAACTVPFACKHADDGLGHHDHSAHAGEHDHHDGEEHGHGDEIILEPETAQRFGVVSQEIQPVDFHQVIPVTGRIVDDPMSASVVSAPTSGIVRFASGIQEGRAVSSGAVVATISSQGISGGDSNKADKAALDAAKRELDRIRPLYEEGIVSAKDYNAALEAYETARTRYSSEAANGTARTVSAGVISSVLVSNGQYVEAGTPIATVSANRRLTLRADVPDRYLSSLPLVESARIVLPYDNQVLDLAQMSGARVSGPDAAMRRQPGYIPVYFTFESNGKTLPQTLVDVILVGAPRPGVMAVPAEAVIEQQGSHFVFVQVDEEGYVKTPVILGASDGERVEVVAGINPGDRVVVKGATTVRLAETSAVVPEGHSHSH